MGKKHIKHSAARERALEALRQGRSMASAAAAAGICRSTLWKWQNEDAAFREAVDDAVDAGTDRLEDAVMGKALAMDDSASVQAARIMLGARRPGKYRERHEVQHNHRLMLSDVMEQLGYGGEAANAIEGEVVEIEPVDSGNAGGSEHG